MRIMVNDIEEGNCNSEEMRGPTPDQARFGGVYGAI
jgi:hypothetical protein